MNIQSLRLIDFIKKKFKNELKIKCLDFGVFNLLKS
jgi:hypothetical protein